MADATYFQSGTGDSFLEFTALQTQAGALSRIYLPVFTTLRSSVLRRTGYGGWVHPRPPDSRSFRIPHSAVRTSQTLPLPKSYTVGAVQILPPAFQAPCNFIRSPPRHELPG